MPKVRRSRSIGAEPQAVWSVVGDPKTLSQWWPRARRVEAVTDDAWTIAFRTDKGKSLRADFRLLESDPPHRRSWYQELEDSPFERLMSEAVTEVSVEPSPEGSLVTLTVRQRMRGLSRLGSPLVRSASRRLLDEALDGLEQACA